MRKVFLDDLPHKQGIGANSNKLVIDWLNCINCYVNFIYDNISGIVQITNKINNHLTLNYNNKFYKIAYSEFSKCQLGNILNVYHTDFIYEIDEKILDNKRSLMIISLFKKKDNNNYHNRWYKYRCSKCGYIGEISETHLIGGEGCSCCNGKISVLGINTIWDTDRWMCDLGVSEEDAKKYTSQSQKYVYPICPLCGKRKNKSIKIQTIFLNKSIHCTCGDGISYSNKLSYALLDQLNEFYKLDYLAHEYSPDWIKPKRYDNYFEYKGNKYILEMDGGFHYRNNTLNGETVIDSQIVDKYKDKLANENNIEIIRIDCNYNNSKTLDYIKNNILNSKLSKLFDLTKIAWDKCEEFALKNIVKQVCDIKKNNNDYTSSDISKQVGLCTNTIISYLEKGTILGWCNYNPKYESIKNKCMPVKIFKDNKCLGTFSSEIELSNNSELLYGVFLNSSGISRVCLKNNKTYKGFTFKFVG